MSRPRASGLCGAALSENTNDWQMRLLGLLKLRLGLIASIADAKFVGVYEHLYDNNVFGEEGCRADARTQPRLPAADYEGSAAQLLSLDDPNRVHCLRFIRTRAYFL